MLGADTRATAGSVVFEKCCSKIHYVAPNIYCCGAGTAADTEKVTELISSNLELHRLATKRESRISTALTMLKSHLFKYQGYVSAALVLGGVDFNGPHLYTVYPHGSTDRLPYVTMGSGSLAAMAMFESRYKDNMNEEEAKKLVYEAISAGIYNDLGSGGNVDLCVLTKGNTEYLRGYAKENERKYRRPDGYNFKPGTTKIINEMFIKPLSNFAVVTEGEQADQMDTT